jgi:serine/threonine protein kinase
MTKKICNPRNALRDKKSVSRTSEFQSITPDFQSTVSRLYSTDDLCSIIACEIMALTIGAQLGSHEITALLGKGGMGEVYRARDLKLKREVAIKILPEEFSRDADRVSRFQREAEVLASLNHPNIGNIYDLGEQNGSRYLVLELVEGESLTDLIARGPIPVEEALRIALQICEALEVAHERGIIHRDLKPANIRLTPNGRVKVLDFGLAKAFRDQPQTSLSNSPTLMNASVPGVILGTAAYMSPEQARGKSVDARTDIWALGCILYEMLTAKPAFDGETTTDILAKIIEGEPNWSRLPAQASGYIRTLLEIVLNKDRKQRLQHVGDVRVLLNQSPLRESPPPAPVAGPARRRAWLVRAVVSLAFLATLIPTGLYFLRAPEQATEISFEMSAPGIINESLLVSPDGQRVAYVATVNGKKSIWIRNIGSASAQQLAGTDNAQNYLLSWAPDSLRLGFFADGQLKKIDVTGGAPTSLAVSPIGAPGAWNSNGDILFSAVGRGGLIIARVSDAGGEVTPLTVLDPSAKDRGHFAPMFLPDERRFLYVSAQALSDTQADAVLYAGSLDKKPATRLRSLGIGNNINFNRSPMTLVKPGWLLFALNGPLLAERVSADGASLSQEPFRVAERVAAFSASEKLLVYRRGSSGAPAQPGATNQLAWLDRTGKPLGFAGDPGNYFSVSLSPDNRRAAIVKSNNTTQMDVWVMELDRGAQDPVAARPGYDFFPAWAPDGREIAFGSQGDNAVSPPRLYRRSSISVGGDTLLLDGSPMASEPQDWSSDGKFIIFISNSGGGSKRDLWYLPLSGDAKPIPYLESNASKAQAQLSPDGRWLAYSTDESGSFQIVVQSFPDPKGSKIVVTRNGGTEPRWRRSDGGELYYLAPDGKLMVVPVKGGNTFEPGRASTLFQTPLPAASPSVTDFRYDVTRDGKRFLIVSPTSVTTGTAADVVDSTPITAVFNWTSTLHKK